MSERQKLASGASGDIADISSKPQDEGGCQAACVADSKVSLLSAIMDAFPCPFAVSDKFGQIVLKNIHWNFVSATSSAFTDITNDDDALMDAFGVAASLRTNSCEAATQLREVLGGERSSCTVTHEFSDGRTVRWFQMDVTAIRDLPGHVAIIHKDISDLRQAKCDIDHLSTELLTAQDSERRRIARTIHDTTAQELVVSKLYLERALESVEKSGNFYASGVKALDHLGRSLCDIRTLSYLLHPPDLDEFDFNHATRLFVKGFVERTGINVVFDVVTSLPAMSADVARVLFLIIREALTNVYRHSGTKTAVVLIRHGDGKLVLEITDYGRGFPTCFVEGGFSRGPGVGIASMRARAGQYHGTLAIESNDCGATLRVVFSSVDLERSSNIALS